SMRYRIFRLSIRSRGGFAGRGNARKRPLFSRLQSLKPFHFVGRIGSPPQLAIDLRQPVVALAAGGVQSNGSLELLLGLADPVIAQREFAQLVMRFGQ